MNKGSEGQFIKPWNVWARPARAPQQKNRNKMGLCKGRNTHPASAQCSMYTSYKDYCMFKKRPAAMVPSPQVGG